MLGGRPGNSHLFTVSLQAEQHITHYRVPTANSARQASRFLQCTRTQDNWCGFGKASGRTVWERIGEDSLGTHGEDCLGTHREGLSGNASGRIVWESIREDCLGTHQRGLSCVCLDGLDGRKCHNSCVPNKKNPDSKGRVSQSLHSAVTNVTDWNVAWLVECLPSIHKILGLIPSTSQSRLHCV